MSALRLAGISARRGQGLVLEGVDLTFGAGRLTAVIGPNGAGKSTLLEVAAGLLPPAVGTVFLGETPLTTLSRKALARRRAYLPQNPRIDWAISVERVVALGLTAHLPAFGGLARSLQTQVDAALRRYDLEALRDRPATRLSGGELARAMLARAIVGAPELLIADEPLAGLDPRHAIDAGRRLRALADEGCTVAVTIHDLQLALAIADDVVAVKGGRVIAQGSAEALFTDAVLSDLYDLPVRVVRQPDGGTVRFG